MNFKYEISFKRYLFLTDDKAYIDLLVGETMNKLDDTTNQMFQRYLNLINKSVEAFGEPVEHVDRNKTSMSHLKWMCEHCLNTNMPIDKKSRWLGFIQGILTYNNYITVSEERDFSRPLFHAAYEEDGTNIPPTVDPWFQTDKP